MSRIRLIWIPCFALLTVAAPATAADRALLVGVSDYPAASVGDLQLTGPRNDVALMFRTLREAGFEDRNITILADGFEKAGESRRADGEPTRAAILLALEKMTREAASGDQIMVYLSGHGSQAPITDRASLLHHPDGLNPIFLPIDIGKWNDAVGAVENAIPGDEFGLMLTGLRKKGAFVWVVVDACHSGTITRSAEQGMIAKKIEPSALGVPAARIEAAHKLAAAEPVTRGGPKKKPVSPLGAPPPAEGGYVAFFAAHPDELAIQRNLPKGYGGGERRPHGVLTFYLAQAMRSGRAGSYADLAQMVLAGYDQWGAAAPTPLFEGELRAPVLGGAASGVKLFAARVERSEIVLDAGALDEISEGALVAIGAANEPAASPLGFARVTSAGPTSSRATPVGRGGAEPVAIKALDDAGRLTARLEERGLAFEMSVATPGPLASATPQEQRALDAIARIASADGGAPPTIRFVGPSEPADVYLKIEDGRVWFAGEDGAILKSGRGQTSAAPVAGFTTVEAAQTAMIAVLRRQLKVRNLLRVAESMGVGPANQSLEIKAALYQPAFTPPPANARAPDDRPCAKPSMEAIPIDAQPLDGGSLPPLAHCDVMYFSLRNIGKNPVDVTPLYIDGGGAIGYMGPAEGLRLLPGAPPRLVPVTIVTYDQRRGEPFPIGLERLLFIAVEQPDRAALPADFRYLQQPALVETARARGGSNALRALLEEAAFGTARTRGGSVGPSIGAAGVAQFRWKVEAPK